MNIGVDMMGGDFAPLEAVRGLQTYLSVSGILNTVFCIGDELQIKQLLTAHRLTQPNIVTVNAPEVIGMQEHPARALKEKRQSSIAVGFEMLAAGDIDAFVSAGNSGAMLVGAMQNIKTLNGVLRPAISAILPKLNGNAGILLDVGLNADCKPENLNQFALLGSMYASVVHQINNPKVALLNIGEEEGKGNLLAQSAYHLLKENHSINFVGNIEGRDIFGDKTDVIVCDGFTGNVVLKMAESIYDIKVARKINDDYLQRFHYENYGGTPVLGVTKPVIIGHGISKACSFSNMISLAERMFSSNVIGDMENIFKR